MDALVLRLILFEKGDEVYLASDQLGKIRRREVQADLIALLDKNKAKN